MNLSRRNFIKIAGLSAAAVAGAALFTGCSGQLMLPVRFSATVIGKDIQKALDTKQFFCRGQPEAGRPGERHQRFCETSASPVYVRGRFH